MNQVHQHGPIIPKVTQPRANHTASQARAWWGPFAGIGILLVLFIVPEFLALPAVYGVFSQMTGQAEYTQLSKWLTTSTGNFWMVLLTDLFVLGLVGLIVYVKRCTISGLGLGALKVRHFLKAVVWFVLYIGIYLAVLAVVTAIVPGFNAEQERDIGFNDLSSTKLLLAVFFVLVVLTPIVEEIMFRGFLYGGFRSRMPFWLAALLTSLLFGAVHLSSANDSAPVWVAACDTFVLSFVLCYAREKSGSLWPPIFIHGFKNAMAFVFLYLVQ
ncbi:MAG: prolyl-tRNA synthetase [Patescibacteria group bacterium]|nr:CPBP family intramembrane metalloprotease [Candidatus Saccharibacteria bacterium]MDQ5963702.1 prolyl-tRNA synthetase [Patescibacteria group bacterium]